MRIKIDGVHLNYELAGQGKTLVLIHGLRSSLASWRPFIPALAEHYQVLVWDVRGHGQSDKPDEEYTVSLWAQDLSLLLHKLDIAKAYVLGISMGGVLAQRFTLDYPDMVEALILASTSSEVGERATRAWEAQAEQLEREGQGQPDELTRAGIRAIRAIARYNFTPELSRIRCPTLILQGENDTLTPPGGSVIMHRNIPGSQLVFLQCGHAIPSEQPQLFVQHVLGFLKRVEEGKNPGRRLGSL